MTTIGLLAQELHEATIDQVIAMEIHFFPHRPCLVTCFPFPDLQLLSSSPTFSDKLGYDRRNWVFAWEVNVPYCDAIFRVIVNDFASCDQVIDRGSIVCCFPRTKVAYQN